MVSSSSNRSITFIALVFGAIVFSGYSFVVSPLHARFPLKVPLTSMKRYVLQKEQQLQTQPSILVSNNPGGEIVGGDSSISTSTFNLAKSIIGAGVLSLPNGVAFFSSDPKALIPSSIICVIFGLVASYTFSSIGKVCQETKSKSFKEAWSNTVNPRSAWMITASITAMCFFASLAYSIIIGDSFSSLAQTFNVPGLLAQRNIIIISLTLAVLLPLCSLRNLSALAPFSLLGLAGTLYTGIFMAIRYFDGSYAPGGKFFDGLPLVPIFSGDGFKLNHLTFVLLSMLSTAYIAHYSAPTFYNELQNPTMSRFNTVVGGAFGASIAFFLFIMGIGYSTFGGNTLGFVLNNYSRSDSLATVARFAIGIALLTGYPFTFSALREGILDFMKVPTHQRSKMSTPVTLGMLSVLTMLALVLKDVGFVVSVSGALFGCLLMFIVPAVMNIRLLTASGGNKSEVFFNYGIVGTGVIMAILGVYVSIMKQMGQL